MAAGRQVKKGLGQAQQLQGSLKPQSSTLVQKASGQPWSSTWGCRAANTWWNCPEQQTNSPTQDYAKEPRATSCPTGLLSSLAPSPPSQRLFHLVQGRDCSCQALLSPHCPPAGLPATGATDSPSPAQSPHLLAEALALKATQTQLPRVAHGTDL